LDREHESSAAGFQNFDLGSNRSLGIDLARGENFGDEILDLFWEETAPLMEGITFLARARKGAPVLASPGARERGD
jgi:hypothetical protein